MTLYGVNVECVSVGAGGAYKNHWAYKGVKMEQIYLTQGEGKGRPNSKGTIKSKSPL